MKPRGERLNTLTHAVGVLLALVGWVLLADKAWQTGDGWKITGSPGFGFSMTALYVASVLFHCSQGPQKLFWATVDHCAIYLLIVGTCMPFALVTVRDISGSALFTAVCALAAPGIGKELWWGRESGP